MTGLGVACAGVATVGGKATGTIVIGTFATTALAPPTVAEI